MAPSKPLTSRPASPRPRPAYPTRLELGFSALAATTVPGCNLLGPIVAPLFEHGSGHVSFGCIAVTPATYLSEERALEILREEFAAVDLTLLGPGACSGYAAHVVSIHACGDGWEETEVTRGDRLDACTGPDGIGVEVMTREDFHDLEITRGICPISGGSNDFKDMAHHVAGSIVATGQGSYAGVLYEPAYIGDTGEAGEAGEEEQLRLQARDLIAWLRERGAI
jgi:hypothetical protein